MTRDSSYSLWERKRLESWVAPSGQGDTLRHRIKQDPLLGERRRAEVERSGKLHFRGEVSNNLYCHMFLIYEFSDSQSDTWS